MSLGHLQVGYAESVLECLLAPNRPAAPLKHMHPAHCKIIRVMVTTITAWQRWPAYAHTIEARRRLDDKPQAQQVMGCIGLWIHWIRMEGILARGRIPRVVSIVVRRIV